MKQENTEKILTQTRDIYNAIAPDFSDTRGKWWQGFGSFNKYVQPGDRVLDLGCGNGRMAEIFADSQIKYLGVDNSEELIKIAKARFANKPWANFMVGDVLGSDWIPCLPAGRRVKFSPFNNVVKNDGYNLVLLIAVLHHIPTRTLRLQVLKNIYNSLQPGGRLVMSNWNLWQVSGKKKNFRYWSYLFNYSEKIRRGIWRLSDALVPWKPLSGENLRYVHSFKLGELKRLLKKAGFKIEKIGFEDQKGNKATIFTGVNSLAVAVKK
jgi:SAM-dependent methyltransferase